MGRIKAPSCRQSGSNQHTGRHKLFPPSGKRITPLPPYSPGASHQKHNTQVRRRRLGHKSTLLPGSVLNKFPFPAIPILHVFETINISQPAYLRERSIGERVRPASPLSTLRAFLQTTLFTYRAVRIEDTSKGFSSPKTARTKTRYARAIKAPRPQELCLDASAVAIAFHQNQYQATGAGNGGAAKDNSSRP